jgi:hypothetical protein
VGARPLFPSDKVEATMNMRVLTRYRTAVCLGWILVAGLARTASAATITAASCSSADVASAVAAANDGDTVVIPNGSCTWSTGVNVSKQIIISGQTKGGVNLTHNAGSGNLFSITTGPTFSTEIRNLNFLVTGGSGGRYLDIGGSGKVPLVHDNYFRVPDFVLIHAIRLRRNGGVFWNNTFESLTPTASVGGSGSGSGGLQINAESSGSSWTTRSTMGADDTTGTANVYIENNVFNNIFLQAIDCDNNARTVIRHNTFNDSAFVCHGADTSSAGQRHTEVYNNTFTFHASGSNGPVTYPLTLNRWWYVRGGTGVVTDNIMADISSQMWGNKPELDFTIQNLRRNAGPNPCCTTYPCKNQVGQSHNGSSLTTEPLYVWNNTGGGSQTPSLSDYSPNQCSASAPSTSSFVQAGRDYVVGTPKPNYTKYAHPHPLRTSGSGTGPRPPTAPTNFRVTQ